jgi:translin
MNPETIGQTARSYLELKHAARERALPKSRAAIRFCANSIRASHRHDFAAASQLLRQAEALLTEMRADLRDHLDIYYAGFVEDAQKEFAEASLTCSFFQRQPLPLPDTLHIEWAPYLNGLGETVGELRRYILDQMRQGKLDGCEAFLRDMDDVYLVLTTLDFPDAITGNLRRTTDSVRGILEKTRGDLTVAVSQAQLAQTVARLEQRLSSEQS